MADFPAVIPSITTPTTNDTPAGVSHSTQHRFADVNIPALATKLGYGSDTPTQGEILSSHAAGQSQWRLGAVIDLRDWTGVVNSGNDGTSSIAAAIAQASAYGSYADPGTDETVKGATVLIPGEVFATTITMASNVGLRGPGISHMRSGNDAGAYLGRIKQIAATNAPLISIPRAVLGYSFGDIFLDGNKSHQSVATNHHGIYWQFTTQTLNVTGDASTNVVTTASAHDLAVGDGFMFATLTGGAGLAINTKYWVVSVPSSTTVTISATAGGSAIDFTTNITAGTTRLWDANAHSTYGALDNVIVENFLGTAYRTSPSHLALRFRRAFARKCDSGFWMSCTDWQMVNCVAAECTTRGLFAALGVAELTGFVAFSNGIDIEIDRDSDMNTAGYTGYPRDISILGGAAQYATTHGMHIGSGVKQISVAGMSFSNNSQSGSAAGSHIRSEATDPSITVTACRFSDGLVAYDIDNDGVILYGTNYHTGEYVTARMKTTASIRRPLGANSYADETTAWLRGAGDATLEYLQAFSADTAGAYLRFQKSHTATVGDSSAVSNGETLGQIAFDGSDGSSMRTAAMIRGIVNGTVTGSGTDDMPGALVFFTKPDGAVALTERVRIDTTGSLQFDGTSGPKLIRGTGSPENAVTAPVGSFYLRTDGGASTSFYVKESGTGNTGWVAK